MTTLKEHLRSAPFTLSMSAGYFGFYAHAGFCTAILDAGLTPARVTGCSAGAMIAGGVAAGLAPATMRDKLAALRREHFWDPGLGLGLLRGKLFRRLLDDVLGTETFEAARIPVAMSVWDIMRMRTLSVERGPLAPAIHASCAIPGMFHPVRVLDRWCVDGGVRDRHARASLKPGERVLLHHLVHAQRLTKKELPKHNHVVAVALENMPRPDPFKLHEGMRAYDEAAKRTQQLLIQPVDDIMVA